MKTFVFFGDSVTEGCFELYPTSCGFDTYRRPELVYHHLLKEPLAEKYGDVEIVNAGISGDNSHHALERIDTDVLAKKPDAVVVCFGLNDCFHPLQRYEASLDEIFRRLRDVPRVIFLTPNMFNTYIHPDTLPESLKVANTTMKYQLDGTFDRYIDTARAVCKKHGVTVCDAYAEWKRRYAQGEDMTAQLANLINHPNAAMHRLFADMLLPLL
ncbi:MAG: SGNH/GDSL hydrolase family protein [Eubacteriales bacterium]|jgi:acyl-CoA thioesterase-1